MKLLSQMNSLYLNISLFGNDVRKDTYSVVEVNDKSVQVLKS